jgi:hypothetical protein
MVYDIEFIRQVDGQAEALALEVIRLVGDRIAVVIELADDIYRRHDRAPRPDGFRIRDNDGAIVHEFLEPITL